MSGKKIIEGLREAINHARQHVATQRPGFHESGGARYLMDLADLEKIADAAESTLPKTKVETAYYLTAFGDNARPIGNTERFTEIDVLLERVHICMSCGYAVSLDRPRQEEVPA